MPFSADSQLPYAAFIALASAAWGGYTTLQAARVVQSRTGEHRILPALVKAADVSDHRTGRYAWFVAGDVLVMVGIISLVSVVFLRGSETRIEGALLWGASSAQSILALIVYLLSRGTISDQWPTGGLMPGERPDFRSVSADRSVSLGRTAEKQPVDRKRPLTRQERAQFIERGAEIYESLRPGIERMHRGEYIAISVRTGKFTTTEDDAKLKSFAESLDRDDFLWMGRVGSI